MSGAALCKAHHDVTHDVIPTRYQALAPAQPFPVQSTGCTFQLPHLRARSSSISAWRSAARSCLALSRAVSSSFSLAARTFSSCWACSSDEATYSSEDRSAKYGWKVFPGMCNQPASGSLGAECRSQDAACSCSTPHMLLHACSHAEEAAGAVAAGSCLSSWPCCVLNYGHLTRVHLLAQKGLQLRHAGRPWSRRRMSGNPRMHLLAQVPLAQVLCDEGILLQLGSLD